MPKAHQAAAPPRQMARFQPLVSFWSYAVMDPRLSDSELRVLLCAQSLTNGGTSASPEIIGRLLVRDESEIIAAMERLALLRYLVDRASTTAA
jgi:hypothetical protein